MSEEARRNFSFTPAVNEESRKNRAITVVIRKRDDASSAARTAALTQGRTTPVAITPVAYDLCASVGFQKFATPQLPRGTDNHNLPVTNAPEGEEIAAHFATARLGLPGRTTEATDRINAAVGHQCVGGIRHHRKTRHTT